MADWPTIPDFGEDPTELSTPMRAMKYLLDVITRQKPGGAAPMARVFIQSLDPSIDPKIANLKGVVLKNGDLWIDTANNNKLRFWDEQARGWAATS